MKGTKNLFARVNAILVGCANKDIAVRPLKLQKLIYLNYGDHFILGGEELSYLKFEAWNFGPVISKVYQYYKNYGANYIKRKMQYNGSCPILLDEASIDITVKKYGRMLDSSLVRITHKEGGAWEKSFKEIDTIINHEYIKSEFIKNK